MIRLLLVTLLLLSSAPAYAEWVAVERSSDGETVYVDPDAIRRKGDLAKQWELYDYKTAKTDRYGSYLSSRGQAEYDCVEERLRMLALTTFAGNMLSGKLVHNGSRETTWEPVAPGTVGETLWKFACGKK